VKTNTAVSHQGPVTHEGGRAFARMTPAQALRRSVMACLLWEDTFYEDGQSIGDRILSLVKLVPGPDVAAIAIDAREQQNLRHVPLLICAAMARHFRGKLVSDTIARVIQRVDELSEFLALYWKLNPPTGTDHNGRPINAPLSKQVKLGLAKAFQKFSAYEIAKYNRDASVKLRDVMFLVHPKPKDGTRARVANAIQKPDYQRGDTLRHQDGQGAMWAQMTTDTLESPDTWEVALSGGADKRLTFERLLSENKLGYLALLRNLRGMTDAGVNVDMIRAAIIARRGAQRVLPFRYVAAARACPQLEPAIDQALSEAIGELPVLPGRTVVLVDVSGSMDAKLSAKSDMTRLDAGAALASLINGDVRMYSFSNALAEVPPRRGMAGVDAIIRSQPHGGTELFQAVAAVNKHAGQYDRLIVITDEQATGNFRQIGPQTLPDPNPGAIGYMINVATDKHGVGYGKWRHIDGWSENVIRWIIESETAERA